MKKAVAMVKWDMKKTSYAIYKASWQMLKEEYDEVMLDLYQGKRLVSYK
jgi:hypothetical protein